MKNKCCFPLFFFALSLPVSACSRSFNLVSSSICFWSFVLLLGLLTLRGRRPAALALGTVAFVVYFFLGVLAGVSGFTFVVWLPLAFIGSTILVYPEVRRMDGRTQTKLAAGILGVGALLAWAIWPTPPTFYQACTGCGRKMEEIAQKVENYKFEHESLPEDLGFLNYPACVPTKASAFGRRLYRLQGVKLVPYTYKVAGDNYRISCETGTHLWSGWAKGYPYYCSCHGLIERPSGAPDHSEVGWTN